MCQRCLVATSSRSGSFPPALNRCGLPHSPAAGERSNPPLLELAHGFPLHIDTTGEAPAMPMFRFTCLKRIGVPSLFSANAGLTRSFSVCSFTSLGRDRIDVPSRSSAHAGFARSSSMCQSASLGQPLAPSRRIFRSRSPTPVVYSMSTTGGRSLTATVPNLFRSHFPITMRCTGVASAYQRESLLLRPPR